MHLRAIGLIHDLNHLLGHPFQSHLVWSMLRTIYWFSYILVPLFKNNNNNNSINNLSSSCSSHRPGVGFFYYSLNIILRGCASKSTNVDHWVLFFQHYLSCRISVLDVIMLISREIPILVQHHIIPFFKIDSSLSRVSWTMQWSSNAFLVIYPHKKLSTIHGLSEQALPIGKLNSKFC